MSELSDIQIGQSVEVADNRIATVRFAGKTLFATGEWLGVELADASGKNDGQVQGHRYFDCPAGHGMFVRPGTAKIIDYPKAKPATRANGKTNGVVTKGRPSSMVAVGPKRQSVQDPTASKRQSMNAGSPTPAGRLPGVSRLASPSKSPTKQLGSTALPGNLSRANAPTNNVRKSMLPPSEGPRTSVNPLTRTSRPSMATTRNGTTKLSSTSLSLPGGRPNPQSTRPSFRKETGSGSGESLHSIKNNTESQPEGLPVLEQGSISQSGDGAHDDRSTEKSSFSPSRVSALSPSSTLEGPVSNRGRSMPTTVQRTTLANSAVQREIEDLKTKLRLMEKKRMEDREKLKTFEKIQTDRDRFEGIIQKLQSKYQPQQQEIVNLKRQLKEEVEKLEAVEAQQAENDTINEMATLDREMAEETAESLKTELDSLRQRHEELELEVDVLRAENQELGKEMSPEEKTSQGWLQMERSNERLREALMRLRDVTQQQEADLRGQVAELEQDVQQLDKIKEEQVHTKEQLLQADGTVEDLRLQLDTALGAEEMIEELTEKNMTLTERIDELKSTIEDLESLKELNDELEINHTENEKQLQEEIDYNEALLAEEARKSAVQDGTIQDLEYTIARFRDLAKSMQSDLEDMRASQQITETEANELSNRSRAMMDLNLRLQESASKAQVKAIDLELGKLEAQESSEHLAILQLFLPERVKSEQGSVQALLRFRRIGFKARTTYYFIKEKVNGQQTPGQEDDIFAYCDVLDNLTWLMSTCDRFINHIRACDIEAFRRLGSAVYELEPVERALNGWIGGLKRDDLKAEQCATELQRSIALMAHLAELHISDSLEHYADDVIMRALMMQSQLENAAMALAHIKSCSEDKLMTSSEDDEEENNMINEYFHKVDTLVIQTRSAKVISSKVVRHLEELKSRSLALESSTIDTVIKSQDTISHFASATRTIGVPILKILMEERNTPVRPDELSSKASLSSLATKVQSAVGQLQLFYNLANSLTHSVEFPSPPPPPWKLLAEDMRAATVDIALQGTELARLKDEVIEKNTTLAIKEKIFEEMSVKVEVLEKRVGESSGRREKVRELEAIVETAQSKETDSLARIDHLQHQLQQLEAECEKWKQTAQTRQAPSQPGQAQNSSTTSAASIRQIENLKAEIKALQSSVRYLRSASLSRNLAASYDFLSNPLRPSEPPPPLIQTESRDVLKEMLSFISQPDKQIIKLQPREKAQRLRWQPARETSTWKFQKQKEEWEEWREWRDAVAKKSRSIKWEEERRREARANGTAGKSKGDVIASLQAQLPGKMAVDQQVRIVRPGEWEGIEEALGLEAG